MPWIAIRVPKAGRRLLSGAVVLFLAAGFSAGRIALPPPYRIDLSASPGSRTASSQPPSETVPEARAKLEQAIQINGRESSSAADAMDALVKALTAAAIRADFPEAMKWAKESLRIRESACPAGCSDLAASLDLYEALLWRSEDYAAALSTAESGVELRTRLFGPEDPTTAHALYLAAEAHRALGEFAAAEALHLKAAEIWGRQPEAHAADLAATLHYQGVIHWKLGDFTGARDRIKRSLEIREKVAGPESTLVAADLNTLGVLEMALRDDSLAASLFDRAQAIWERAGGPSRSDVARALSNKAQVLAAAGDHAGAGALLQQALRIRIGAFGPHYLVARSFADLARNSFAAGNDSEAERLFSKALEIQEKDPELLAPELGSTLSDLGRVALAMGDSRRAIQLSLRAEAVARDYFLRTSRGLSEERTLLYKQVQEEGLDVALTALASLRPRGPEGTEEILTRIWDEEIRSRALVLDRVATMHRASPSPNLGSPDLSGIIRALPPAATLIAYVRYGDASSRSGGSHFSYLALVAEPGQPPRAVPLGGAESIDSAIGDWRSKAQTDPRLNPSPSSEERYQAAARRVRHMIWDPLGLAPHQSRMVFVVPDGAVSLVSLATLPEDDGHYLIESRPAIHYLSAERDILAPASRADSGGELLAVGGADFDAAADSLESFRREIGGASSACPSFLSLRFDPLAGSRREIDDVASLWSRHGAVLKMTGDAATEGAFKSLAPGKKILHLATHGFVLNARCPSFLSGALPLEGGVAIGENPMLLSGLALAGANHHARADGGHEDGILTAQEIGALNLFGTEWAVLSGCETGLGEVLSGEGVIGLRRAFQVAGVGTLIMSLWPVDDGAAQVWMHYLYEGRLEGLSTVDSVTQASRKMIASQRDLGQTTHPYFWGAFIASGDWR